ILVCYVSIIFFFSSRTRHTRLQVVCFFFQAEDGIRDYKVTGVQTCALPISREDRELHAALLAPYALNVPDGQPLVWAINALGHSLSDRVYGPELMARAFARGATTEHRFYLYGGRDQDALLKLGLSLRRRFPAVNIVGGFA